MNSMLAHTLNWAWVFTAFAFLTMMIPTIRDHYSALVPQSVANVCNRERDNSSLLSLHNLISSSGLYLNISQK